MLKEEKPESVSTTILDKFQSIFTNYRTKKTLEEIQNVPLRAFYENMVSTGDDLESMIKYNAAVGDELESSDKKEDQEELELNEIDLNVEANDSDTDDDEDEEDEIEEPEDTTLTALRSLSIAARGNQIWAKEIEKEIIDQQQEASFNARINAIKSMQTK